MFLHRYTLRIPFRNQGQKSNHFRNAALASGAAFSIAMLTLALPAIHADDLASLKHPPLRRRIPQDPSIPLASLIRTYAVYSMCSVPLLVDNAPNILAVLRTLPGARQLTDALVRATFFSQFVGGDTAQQTLPLLLRLRNENKGAIFAYSVEVDALDASGATSPSRTPTTAAHKRIVDEMIRSIDVAADFEDGLAASRAERSRKTWVAIKMTALLPDANALATLSTHILKTRTKDITFPGCPTPHDLDVLHVHGDDPARNASTVRELTQADVSALKDLHVDLIRICTRAAERGIKVVVDAEHSWYQPAIDALTLSLMQQFNKLPDSLDRNQTNNSIQPLVYVTFQAYLRRTPAYLTQSILDAKANHYALGVKLVRGAYHSLEVATHQATTTHSCSPSISPHDTSPPPPPVWSTKEETDACYNECARVLVRAVRDDIVSESTSQDLPASMTKRLSPLPLPTIGVLFGTHNWTSCNVVLDELVACGLASKTGEGGREGESGGDVVVQIGDAVTERVTVGQLYGMSDALTDYLVGKTRCRSPFVLKYVPYGALSEVIPYLGRRAIENKSVLGAGGAIEERKRAWAAIRKRLFG